MGGVESRLVLLLLLQRERFRATDLVEGISHTALSGLDALRRLRENLIKTFGRSLSMSGPLTKRYFITSSPFQRVSHDGVDLDTGRSLGVFTALQLNL